MDQSTMLSMQRFSRTFVARSRLKILWFLLHNGDTRVAQLRKETGISAGTLSRHMRLLADAGVVQVVRDREGLLYSFASEGLRQGLSTIASTFEEGTA